MAIQINPNRINVNSGKTASGRREATGAYVKPVTPKRAHENFIPSPEALLTLVTGAVEALRQGVRWDRGTILNLLV